MPKPLFPILTKEERLRRKRLEEAKKEGENIADHMIKHIKQQFAQVDFKLAQVNHNLWIQQRFNNVQ